MNFNLGELENLFYNIEDIIDYVEKAGLDTRKTKIYLGNNESFTLSIPKESIPHLLGINTSYLASTKIFNSTNSFEILKELIENPYRIYNLEKDDILNYNQMFSPYILNKIESFKENIKINIYETEFVCKYNTTKSYMSVDNAEKYDYILVKKYSDGRIGVLGLVKNEYNYVARSNQIFSDFKNFSENMKDTFTNQEITLISGVNIFNKIDDYNKNFKLNLETKKQKVINMLYYKNNFGASIDVSGDYIHNIGLLGNEKHDRFKRVDTVEDIIENIIEGKIINEASVDDENLLKIVQAYNDSLCKKVANSEEINKTYTDCIKELKEFKMLVEDLKKDIKKLEDEKDELTFKNKELEDQNKENDEIINGIVNMIKPRM